MYQTSHIYYLISLTLILYVKGTINTYFYSEYYLHIILLVKTTYIAIPVILRWRSLKKQPCEALPNKLQATTTVSAFHLLDVSSNQVYPRQSITPNISINYSEENL